MDVVVPHSWIVRWLFFSIWQRLTFLLYGSSNLRSDASLIARISQLEKGAIHRRFAVFVVLLRSSARHGTSIVCFVCLRTRPYGAKCGSNLACCFDRLAPRNYIFVCRRRRHVLGHGLRADGCFLADCLPIGSRRRTKHPAFHGNRP